MSWRNRILLLVLAVLGGLALALERPWRGDAFARTAARVQRLFPGLEAARQRIARVEIRSADLQTTLQRAPQGWVVEEKLGYPADVAALAELVAALEELDDRDTVSVNPQMRTTYSVDESAGTRVRVLDVAGSSLADLISGALRGGPEQAGRPVALEFYVRRADRDEVVLAATFRPPPADPADWLAPRLLPSVQARDVRWIQRQDHDGGESWRLVRDAAPAPSTSFSDSGWRMVAPDDRPALAQEAEAFLLALLTLRPQDVAARVAEGSEPGPEYGFPRDVLRCGAGDRSFEVWLGAPTADGRRHAWVPGSPWLVLVGEEAAARLRRAPAELARTS